MNPVTLELEEALRRLDPGSAATLEQVVRSVLTLATRAAPANGAVDANGYPVGYFEETAGSFANEPFEVPEDLPPKPTPAW